MLFLGGNVSDSLIFTDFKSGQHGVAVLDILGGKGSVQVNGKTYKKKCFVNLSGGDEVVFGSCGKHAYVSFFDNANNICYLFFFFLWIRPLL